MLKHFYEITEDLKGSKLVGIDIKWDYNKRTCRLTMDGYIIRLFIALGHLLPVR